MFLQLMNLSKALLNRQKLKIIHFFFVYNFIKNGDILALLLITLGSRSTLTARRKKKYAKINFRLVSFFVMKRKKKNKIKMNAKLIAIIYGNRKKDEFNAIDHFCVCVKKKNKKEKNEKYLHKADCSGQHIDNPIINYALAASISSFFLLCFFFRQYNILK